jgi:uncharacterized membrane protein YfcA
MELLTVGLVLALTGIVVGFGEGFLGIGGSFMMVPVVFWLLSARGTAPDTAIKVAFGSALLVVLPTSLSGTVVHTRREAVWWRAALILGLCGTVGALVGSTITARLLGVGILRPLFGLAIALGAIRMLVGEFPGGKATPEYQPLSWAGLGFATGILSGLIGVGGGIVMVPLLSMAFHFTMHRAVGTSLAMIIFTSFGGTLGYILNGLTVQNLPPFSVGYVNLPIWACLAFTSIPVAQLGAHTAHRLPAQQLRYAFSAVLLYIALRMIGLFEWLGVPL